MKWLYRKLTNRRANRLCAEMQFDPEFYRNTYPDTAHLQSKLALVIHFKQHGLTEGRWRNSAEAEKAAADRRNELPEGFNWLDYQSANPDLAGFQHSWQLEEHFLNHGKAEGRPLSGVHIDTSTQLKSEPLWANMLQIADFHALNDTWLPRPLPSREEAIEIFLAQGIRRLAPLRADLIFDPSFYRLSFGLSYKLSDKALYEDWLSSGAAAGRAPNETAEIWHMVGDQGFPEVFDWHRYKQSLPKKVSLTLKTRGQVLRHLFDEGFPNGTADHLFAKGWEDLILALATYYTGLRQPSLALRACDAAIILGVSSPRLYHLRGDANRLLNRSQEAIFNYQQAINAKTSDVAVALNLLDMLIEMNDLDAAFDTAISLVEKWLHLVEFRSAYRRVIDAVFTAASNKAMDLYRGSRRDEGDRLLLKILKQIDETILLPGSPAAVAPVRPGHVAILANMDIPQCTYYRVEQKRRALNAVGTPVYICNMNEADAFTNMLIGASSVIFYRTPAFPRVIHAINTAKKLGIPTYFDIDDLVFSAEHYPDPLDSFEGQIDREEHCRLMFGVPLFLHALRSCDRAIASTPSLAKQLELLAPKVPVSVVRNGLDDRNERMINLGSHPRPDPKYLHIFYGSGTKAHNSDFNQLVAPALRQILCSHPNVKFVVIGHLKLDSELNSYKDQIIQFPFVDNLDEYWSILASCDINLAVLRLSAAADSKSEIKWLEAAAVGVPSIVSPTANYKEVLTDGVNAIFAEDAQSWRSAIQRLLNDATLRRQIANNAREKALSEYGMRSISRQLTQVLKSTSHAGSGLASSEVATKGGPKRRPKILICNVFFPPQTYGGATRVVRENVDNIIDDFPDFELIILTSDDGVSEAGRLRLDNYRGVPVYRVSCPIKEGMDWYAFDEINNPIFNLIIESIKPDLVHFHCMQRLGATLVETVAQRGIPYLITLHDAWWISDHQFLVDADGMLHTPSSNLFAGCPPTFAQKASSVARQRRLAQCLVSATHLLPVSASFADVYRECGFSNILVMENGLPKLAKPLRRRVVGRGGRVSLGHIGGRSPHKGATLVEAVLRTEKFKNLRLTMIDGRMHPGSAVETVWGTTPVRLSPHVPQDEISAVYDDLDVLLAPSTWPESFGLVAREAAAAGLWVVASDRGAMGDNVVEDVDGYRVDVSSTYGLRSILRRIDSAAERYVLPPPRRPKPQRTAAEQSADLANLYLNLTS